MKGIINAKFSLPSVIESNGLLESSEKYIKKKIKQLNRVNNMYTRTYIINYGEIVGLYL